MSHFEPPSLPHLHNYSCPAKKITLTVTEG
jgi:hypothetical protein